MIVTEPSHPRIAIACQGGGSHTAFTAGVLDRLLSENDVEFDIVGLSGTSGGAICAFTTWFGLASEGQSNGRPKAKRLLTKIWDDIAAKTLPDVVANAVGVGTVRAQGMGVPIPMVSPYDFPVSDWSRKTLRTTLEKAITPDDLATVAGRTDPLPPRLDIGAVDIQRGTFKTFTERDVTHDAVLASAAVPPLFRAAPVTNPDGITRWYWDGLFSQNPPLGDFFSDTERRLERADELWVIQINPQRRENRPRKLEEIQNRRNELGGNLSVNQELRFIRLLNQWLAEGRLDGSYQPIEVKTINLDESIVSPKRSLDYATKLDRSPAFLDRLWDHGREQAEHFLATERDQRVTCETVETTWNGERDVFDERVTPTFDAHLPTSLIELRNYLRGEPEQETTTLGREEYLEFTKSLREAIPDLRVSIEEVVTERNKVAIRWLGTGTHDEEIIDIEPTGKEVTLSGMRIDHLSDGRLTESWMLSEHWSLLRQVDVIEPTAPLATASRVTATPVVTQLSAPAENEELARIEIGDVWNRGCRDALDRILSDSCVLHLDGADDVYGRAAYWEFVQRYRNAFSDLDITIDDTISEGDKIVLRMTMRGMHEEPFLGVEPTGERIEVARMAIHHINDGRIVETGLVEDTVRLLHQLNSSPSEIN